MGFLTSASLDCFSLIVQTLRTGYPNRMEVVLIHGYLGFPTNCWFPWLRHELEEKGFHVTAPAMPSPAFPNKKAWVETIKALDFKPSETILVGHSLGCLALLNYLQQYSGPPFRGCVLVAGFGRDFMFHNRVTDWFDSTLNFAELQQKSLNWTCIHSKNDKLVPFEEGEWLAEQLHAKLIIETKGHLTKREGAEKLPSVLDAILNYGST